MAGDDEDSVTVWLAALKAGDADAAQKLWQRYFETLVRLARDRLRGAPRTVADECRRLLGVLRDDSLRVVARLRMEGHSNKEVADQLGCSLRTVARKIELIRRCWLTENGIAS
jgi:DNA-binding NarL/FixJ family response regulator